MEREDLEYGKRRAMADLDHRSREELGQERLRVRELERQLEMERAEKMQIKIEQEGYRVKLQEAQPMIRKQKSQDEFNLQLQDERAQNLQNMADVTSQINYMKLQTEHDKIKWEQEREQY